MKQTITVDELASLAKSITAPYGDIDISVSIARTESASGLSYVYFVHYREHAFSGYTTHEECIQKLKDHLLTTSIPLPSGVRVKPSEIVSNEYKVYNHSGVLAIRLTKEDIARMYGIAYPEKRLSDKC